MLGAMLLSPDAARHGIHALTPDDFYSPAHGHVFEAVQVLHESATAIDAVTVADHLRSHGLLDVIGGPATIARLLADTPSRTGAERYAEIVAEHSARRKLYRAFSDLAEQALDLASPADLIDRANAVEAQVEHIAPTPAGLQTLDAFLDAEDTDGASDWVVPGLIRRSWRIVVVAGEGGGKTTLLRQVGICAAAGLHPFLAAKRYEPARVLTLDLENPPEAIQHVCSDMRRKAVQFGDYDPERHWIMHRMGGINLRARRDRAEVEAALIACRPDLVIMGPLYKSFRQTTSEGWELPAKEVADVLDDLRTRHRFALLIEAHAPHGDAKQRDLRPEGSALWMKWPEIGLALAQRPSLPGGVSVERFRGDRLPNEWPTEMHRSIDRWPWSGSWGEGLPAPPAQPDDDEPMF